MTAHRDLAHPRDEIMQTMERIYRYRMTTTSGGNLSIREENGDVWITPARLDKGSLRREDIVCVHGDGTVTGQNRPSSELPFHQEIYRTRHDIRGIVHAHPVALVAFSLVHRIPDTRLFHQARLVCGEAGFAPGVGHGFGFEVVREPAGTFRYNSIGSFVKGGAYRTYGWVDPAKDLVGLIFMQRTNGGGDVADEINSFMAMAAAAIER